MLMLRKRMQVLAAVALLVVLAAACAETLDVVDPDIVPPDNLEEPTALPTVRAAVIGDFAVAYVGSGTSGSGGIEGQIMTSGLLADEWVNSETFPTRIEVDQRRITIDNATMQDIFRQLARARGTAERAIETYKTSSPDLALDPGFPEVTSLAGFTYILFAENYCSGVPFSTADPASGELIYGDPLTTTQMLDTAIARLDAALVAAAALDTSGATATIRAPKVAVRLARISLAKVGKARALLNKGDATGAAAVLAASATLPAVPTSFVYGFTHSENTARQNNGVFMSNRNNRRYAVANQKGVNGLDYRTSGDPRTPVFRTPSTNLGLDATTPQWDQNRYIDRKAFVPLATGLEARLVEAEERLRAGDPGTWLTIHNTLRGAPPTYILNNNAAIAPLSALSDPGTQVAQENLHFRERAFWLWLTSHRLGDMRRLVRPVAQGGLGRAENTVFPTGTYHKSTDTYGPDVNFPVPFDELNNPKFTQCIDRNP